VAGKPVHGRGGSTRTHAPPDYLSSHDASIHPSLIDRQLETLCFALHEWLRIIAAPARREGREGRRRTGGRPPCMAAFCRWPSTGPMRLKRAKRSARGGSRSREKAGESCRPFRRAGVSFGDWPAPGAGAQFPAGDGVDDPVPDAGNDGPRPAQASAGISLLEGTEITEARGGGLPRIRSWDGPGWPCERERELETVPVAIGTGRGYRNATRH